jgi:hypothetical protein
VDLECQGFSRKLDSLPGFIAIDTYYRNPSANPVFIKLMLQR